MAGEKEEKYDLSVLPEECIATVVSFTNPRDACCFSSFSRTFYSATNSNIVWDRFLPSDYIQILARSDGGQSLLDSISKKQLFMNLADTPVLIDGGMMSFSLDKSTGKNCYIIAARQLAISWGDTPSYWIWLKKSKFTSRFSEVAKLLYVWWLEIRGKIKMSMLSPNTKYAAYLVFQVSGNFWGFNMHPVEVAVETAGGKLVTGKVYLDPMRAGIVDQLIGRTDTFPRIARDFDHLDSIRGLDEEARGNVKHPNRRRDGWLEVEVGEFMTTEEDGDVEFSIMEVKNGITKGGLLVEGIEIRPAD